MNKRNMLVLKLIALVFLLIIIILIIKSITGGAEIVDKPKYSVTNSTDYEPTNQVLETTNVADFMKVNDCINFYLNYIYDKNEQGVYSLLIEDYIEKSSIDKSNVLNKVEKIDYENEYMAKKIYRYDQNPKVETFFVFGNILNKDEKNINDNYNYVLNIDIQNMTFEIAPYGESYSEYVDYSDSGNILIKDENIKKIIKSIDKTDYNEAPIKVGVRR